MGIYVRSLEIFWNRINGQLVIVASGGFIDSINRIPMFAQTHHLQIHFGFAIVGNIGPIEPAVLLD